MYRVQALDLVDGHGVAVMLEPDTPGRPPLTVGTVLLGGMRRWRVDEVFTTEASEGRVAVRLSGPQPLTWGLILRPEGEPMGQAEYLAAARVLVRLARAFRHVDLHGIAQVHARLHLEGKVAADRDGVVKTALMGIQLVDGGATDDELAAAAVVLGIGNAL